MFNKRWLFRLLAFVLFLALLPALAMAQDETPAQQIPIETDDNTPGTAIPLNCTASGVISPGGDVDYYSIDFGAGWPIVVTVETSANSPLDAVLTLYDDDGTTVLADQDDFNGFDPQLHFETLENGGEFGSRHYVRVHSFDGAGGSNYTYTINFNTAYYVSMTAAGTVGGVNYERGDILIASSCGGSWKMFFDASDVNLPGNVRDFAITNGNPAAPFRQGYILMALDKQNVPGVGAVAANDLVAFLPTSIGSTTTGTFQWLLDGSDVGLTTKNERIDSLALFGNTLLIGANGRGNVPGAGGFQDEDILRFAPTALGATTSGSWGSSMFFDGSDAGLSGVNTQGIYMSSDPSGLFLTATFDKTITLSIEPAEPNENRICHLLSSGKNTNCTWHISVIGGFSSGGLAASAVLDGLDHGTHWWPAGFTPITSQAATAKPAQE